MTRETLVRRFERKTRRDMRAFKADGVSTRQMRETFESRNRQGRIPIWDDRGLPSLTGPCRLERLLPLAALVSSVRMIHGWS
jgi:hypothetical protein